VNIAHSPEFNLALQLQETALRSAKEYAAAAATPGAMCESHNPARADSMATIPALPHRQAKPTVKVEVTAIDPQDDDDNNNEEENVQDPPDVDISTVSPPPPLPRPRLPRSPDRKRVSSSGRPESPPKRQARLFPGGFPRLVLRPRRGGGGNKEDVKE